MTNFAYFNVAPDAESASAVADAFLNVYRETQAGQDVNQQKIIVLEYCDKVKLSPLKFIEDAVSMRTSWRERSIGRILEQAVVGDTLIVSEASWLAASSLQVIEILEMATKKGIILHFAKDKIIMDGTNQGNVKNALLELILKIEHEFISKRTTEALVRHKKLGHQLGRPKGQAKLLKLDAFHDDILGYLKKGINKRSIAKLIQCSPSTLYQWLKRRNT